MAFPDTHLTLIGRLSSGASEQDWQQFLQDYWGPICRFAARRGRLSVSDAEDVAAKTFESLLTNRLLVRWHEHQGARLRTLLCTVVRHVLANRARVQAGRERLLKEELARGGTPLQAYAEEPTEEPADTFYAAWVDDLLDGAVTGLMRDYHAAGKGDYFRVLHGRLCEGLTMPCISAALGIKLTDAENYFKAARNGLAKKLETSLRQQVARYCDAAGVEAEFGEEWRRLGEFLQQHGGLERAVEACFRQTGGASFDRRSDSFLATRENIRRSRQRDSAVPPPESQQRD
jgi:DNA-directed RNA polymerase specialized sigma24 family protein